MPTETALEEAARSRTVVRIPT